VAGKLLQPGLSRMNKKVFKKSASRRMEAQPQTGKGERKVEEVGGAKSLSSLQGH